MFGSYIYLIYLCIEQIIKHNIMKNQITIISEYITVKTLLNAGVELGFRKVYKSDGDDFRMVGETCPEKLFDTDGDIYVDLGVDVITMDIGTSFVKVDVKQTISFEILG